MRKMIPILIFAAAGLFPGACVVSTDELPPPVDEATDTGEVAEALGPREVAERAVVTDDQLRLLVRLRADHRDCVGPACGGYFIEVVNTDLAERYVSRLDFRATGLAGDVLREVLAAPAGEVMLAGRLGKRRALEGTRPFLADAVYRGLPGVEPEAGDGFYQTHRRSPPIYCIVAPCPNEIAVRLNTPTETAFSAYSVASAAGPWVDQSWLTARIATGSAIVAARFVDGRVYAGGPEKVLDASQVFLRLPEQPGPACISSPGTYCGADVAAFTRDANRCLQFEGCVDRGLCPMFLPVCDAGYSLVSWPGHGGCPSYACDPTFAR